MDVLIPIALIATGLGYNVMKDDDKETRNSNLPTHERKVDNREGIDEYIDSSQFKKVEKTNFRKNTEPYFNTTILKNPGFKPIVDNLYFFKNYYQLSIKQYKISGSQAINKATINLTVDSPKILMYQDGKEFNYEDQKYFDGIIIRAQLLPISDQENNFRLIYEIESTEATIRKTDFAEKSSGSVINSLVDNDINEIENYKVINSGTHIYNTRLYSLDEKIINDKKPYFVQIGDYKIEIKLSKGKYSDFYKNPQDIYCNNKVCEKMKENTILKTNKNPT